MLMLPFLFLPAELAIAVEGMNNPASHYLISSSQQIIVPRIYLEENE
jgi:hypothetical protein